MAAGGYVTINGERREKPDGSIRPVEMPGRDRLGGAVADYEKTRAAQEAQNRRDMAAMDAEDVEQARRGHGEGGALAAQVGHGLRDAGFSRMRNGQLRYAARSSGDISTGMVAGSPEAAEHARHVEQSMQRPMYNPEAARRRRLGQMRDDFRGTLYWRQREQLDAPRRRDFLEAMRIQDAKANADADRDLERERIAATSMENERARRFDAKKTRYVTGERMKSEAADREERIRKFNENLTFSKQKHADEIAEYGKDREAALKRLQQERDWAQEDRKQGKEDARDQITWQQDQMDQRAKKDRDLRRSGWDSEIKRLFDEYPGGVIRPNELTEWMKENDIPEEDRRDFRNSVYDEFNRRQNARGGLGYTPMSPGRRFAGGTGPGAFGGNGGGMPMSFEEFANAQTQDLSYPDLESRYQIYLRNFGV